MKKIELPAFDDVESLKDFDNLIYGSQYNSFFKPRKKRQSVIKKMDVGSPVTLQYYSNEYGDCLLVVDADTGIDVGIISPGTFEYILDNFGKDSKFVGRVIEKGKITPTADQFGIDEIRIEYKLYK